MSNKSLYYIVGNGLRQAAQKGKSPIGYTVDSYKGVLEALKKIKVLYKDVYVQGEAQNIGSRRYSILGQLGLGGQQVDGFVVYGDDEMSYQAVCDVKEYMSFPVDVAGDSIVRTYTPVKRPDETQSVTHILNGMSLQNTSGPTFPVADPQEDTIQSMQTATGETGLCTIGVGISITQLAVKFFNKFFDKSSFTCSEKT